MHPHPLTVEACWKIESVNKLLVSLRHDFNGLPKGTVLRSSKSGLSWEIAGRIAYQQVHDQKVFENETLVGIHFSFASFESLEKFIAEIEENESKGIFDYWLLAEGPFEKPDAGETLYISE